MSLLSLLIKVIHPHWMKLYLMWGIFHIHGSTGENPSWIKKNSKEEKKSDRCFPWVHSLYVFDHNHSHNLSASHQIKPCIMLQFMSALWRETVYWPKPNFTHIWHLVRVKFGSCLSIFLFFDLFGNLSFLGKEFLCAVREKRAERYTRKHTLTNQAVRIPAKPKNAVCIFWGEGRIMHHIVSHTVCVLEKSICCSGRFGTMCLLSNTLHQAILDAIIEIFSCSAVFVLLWLASIFVYPFSCHVLLEIQAHDLLLHSSVFVGGLRAVWERPKGLSRPLTDLIKSDRAKRGSDWEIERGKTKTWPCLTVCEL